MKVEVEIISYDNSLIVSHFHFRKFLSLAYSADGQYLLAAGDSKYICMYSVPDRLLVKRFEITVNMSLEGVQEAHDRRRFAHSAAGRAIREEEEASQGELLPGVRADDRSRRRWRPDVRVTSVKLSPTGMHIGLLILYYFVFFHFISRYMDHVAARAHLGPCEMPEGRKNEILRKD